MNRGIYANDTTLEEINYSNRSTVRKLSAYFSLSLTYERNGFCKRKSRFEFMINLHMFDLIYTKKVAGSYGIVSFWLNEKLIEFEFRR